MLQVRHHPWAAPLRRPRMSNDEDTRPGVALTSRALLRDGVPVIPVTGELHYSRVPRSRWRTRLRQMRAGGVTVVASYVFWLHHAPAPDEVSFDGNLDVAAFADLCAAEELDLILRIGPWCHGETRNGGFPDWVQHSSVRHRTDDPDYLALVREWFGRLGNHLAGRTYLGIQLENELYDQPGHLDTLKALAREAGMAAPLWTATAWGSARLPASSVMPLYGGYGDGFWVDADAPWDPTFRAHYFFSHVWDDPGIGADLRRDRPPAPPSELSPLFPPATAELGGGMATAYHRRPWPTALDVATVAHCKIGNGSAWQGYYMYAGGTNPPGTHESHETGYPNDLQPLGYDFHAPIGEAGTLDPSHALLRGQHAFLAAFGASLTDMPSSLPAVRPSGVEDSSTLRWALRSDGVSGYLFIAWHQPHVPLPPFRGARFEVGLDDDSLVLPSAPVDIPPGTLARWPIRLTLAGVRLDWVTASALTVLPGPTLVLTAAAGVPVEYAVDGVAHQVTPAREPVRVGDLDLLVLPATDAESAWVCSDGPAGRRLLLSEAELTWGPAGRITADGPDVLVYDPSARRFVPLAMTPATAGEGDDSRAGAAEPSAGRLGPGRWAGVAGAQVENEAGRVEAAEASGGLAALAPAGAEGETGRVGPVELPGGRVGLAGAVADGEGGGARWAGGSGGRVGLAGAVADGEGGGVRWAGGSGGRVGLAGVTVEREAGRAVPVSYGKFEGRESAPAQEVFDELAAVYRVELPEWAAEPALDALLTIGWAGDVGQLRMDGRTVTDRFWDGSEWVVNLRDAGYRAGSRVSLHLLPLAAGSPVWLPVEARERLLGSDGQLLALDHVRVAARMRLAEAAPEAGDSA